MVRRDHAGSEEFRRGANGHRRIQRPGGRSPSRVGGTPIQRPAVDADAQRRTLRRRRRTRTPRPRHRHFLRFALKACCERIKPCGSVAPSTVPTLDTASAIGAPSEVKFYSILLCRMLYNVKRRNTGVGSYDVLKPYGLLATAADPSRFDERCPTQWLVQR